MDSKNDIAHAEAETDVSEKVHAHPHTSMAKASHLYQEDSDGKVLGRLLLPRPTNEPNDPLTWSTSRKLTTMLVTDYFVFTSNYITNTISPILVPIMEDFDTSLTRASYLISFNLLFLGLGNLFWIPLSLKIGKRPVIVMGAAVFFFASIWSSVAKDWGSLFGARCLQGFGASGAEALGPAVAADLFFLHERGMWVGIYLIAFSLGSSLGGVFAGFVANAHPDWRMVFWMNTALTGFGFLIAVLFLAETNYQRPEENETGEGMSADELTAIRERASPASWIRAMSFGGWYDKNVSIWWLWWRPFLTLQYPAVLWGIATYGVTLGVLVIQLTINAGVYPSQYNFSPMAVGNASIAYVVATIFGALAGGPFSDWVVRSITKRRGGYFVPEFRLWCMIPACIFGPAGILMWGFGLGKDLHPMVGIVGAGISWGVLNCVPGIGMTYVVDSYRPLAGETMTILNALKNTFSFGLSFAAFPWLAKVGFIPLSGYVLLIEGVIFLTTIPMYIYGERLRTWSSKLVI